MSLLQIALVIIVLYLLQIALHGDYCAFGVPRLVEIRNQSLERCTDKWIRLFENSVAIFLW